MARWSTLDPAFEISQFGEKLYIDGANAAPRIQDIRPVLISLIASMVLLAASEPAAGTTPTSDTTAAAAAPKAAKPAKDKMVCKEEPVTGSRFGKRVCRTEAEWRQLRDDARNDTSRMQVQGDVR